MATRQVARCEQMFYGSRWIVDIEEIRTRIAIREMGSTLSNQTGDTTLRGIASRMGISHMTLHRLFTGGSIGADGMKRILHWIGAELTDVAKPVHSIADTMIRNMNTVTREMGGDGLSKTVMNQIHDRFGDKYSEPKMNEIDLFEEVV